MLGMMAVINSQSVTESMFAEYNVPAYQNYHLLMMDSGYGTEELLLSEVQARMQKLGQENLNPAISGYGKYSSFLQMDVTDCSIVQYELATDDNAGPLLKQIAQLMKKEAAADLVKKVIDVKESDRQGKEAGKYLDGALDTIERAKEEEDANAFNKTENHIGTNGTIKAGNKNIPSRLFHIKPDSLRPDSLRPDSLRPDSLRPDSLRPDSLRPDSLRPAARTMLNTKLSGPDIVYLEGDAVSENDSTLFEENSAQEIENPMEEVKNAKSSPLLSQIISGNISAKQIVKGDTIGQRSLHMGNYEQNSSSSIIIDKILTIQYLKKYTSNYRHSVSMPHALEYEQEFILFGKYSDKANLEKMASRILLIREGINFAYLLTDQAKCDEALAMAAVIAASAGIPGAVKAIQMGLCFQEEK